MNEYEFKKFGITLPTSVKINDIASPNSALGKAWANFLRDLDTIGGHVDANSTISGPGVTNLAVPTKVLAGA